MEATAWLQDDTILIEDGKVILCDVCPCDVCPTDCAICDFPSYQYQITEINPLLPFLGDTFFLDSAFHGGCVYSYDGMHAAVDPIYHFLNIDAWLKCVNGQWIGMITICYHHAITGPDDMTWAGKVDMTAHGCPKLGNYAFQPQDNDYGDIRVQLTGIL